MDIREHFASWRFTREEWDWYVENQHHLNSKAQERWDNAHIYADNIIRVFEEERLSEKDCDICIRYSCKRREKPFDLRKAIKEKSECITKKK